MAASGKAHQPDARGIDSPLIGIGTYHSHGTLGVFQRDGMTIAVSRVAILEHEGTNAQRVEPEGDVAAFFRHREVAIAAARANDDRAAHGLFFRGKENRQRWLVVIGIAFGCRGTVWPEQFGGLLLGAGPRLWKRQRNDTSNQPKCSGGHGMHSAA